MADTNYDPEKEAHATTYLDSDSDVSATPAAVQTGILAKLRSYENALDKKFGIESQGPARVLPEEKDPTYNKWSNQAVMALMWASGTMNLSCFTTGFLGWEFGLDLEQTILIMFFGTLVGAMTTVSSHWKHWIVIVSGY